MRPAAAAGALLAAALLVWPAASAAAHGGRHSCQRDGAREVLENRYGRVVTHGTFEDRLGERHRRYLACSFSEGGFQRLGRRGAVELIRLHRDRVYFTERYSAVPGENHLAVRAVDLLAGGIQRFERYGGAGMRPRITDLAAAGPTPHRVGWIVSERPEEEPPVYSVVRFDACTSPDVGTLDSGTGIGRRSLRFRNGLVSWLNGRQRRSARLYGRDCPGQP